MKKYIVVVCFLVSLNIDQDCFAQSCQVCGGYCSSLGPELVTNGDFSQVASCNYMASAPYLAAEYEISSLSFGQYIITDNPQPYNSFLCCSDHTNGSTNFLCCDGYDGYKTSAWGQEIDISTYPPNTDYVFCVWVCNLECIVHDFNDPIVQLLANGDSLLPSAVALPEEPDEWVLVSAIWNSGSNPPAIVTVEVVTNSIEYNGNDLGVDDISFKACSGSSQILNAGNDLSICSGDSVQLSATGATSYLWSPSNGLSDTSIADPIANPSSTTTYSVYGTDSFGCTMTDTLTITVFPNPLAPTITLSTDTLFCLSPGYSYQWFYNGNLISGATDNYYVTSQSGDYLVMISDSNGCFASSTINAQIQDAMFTVQDSTLCEKFCTVYTDISINDPIAWQWEFEGGSPPTSAEQNPQVCYNIPGTYDVTLISFDGVKYDTITLSDIITVYATPSQPTITENGDTFTCSIAYAYQWLLNDVPIPGATNQSCIAFQPGIYTVVIANQDSCTSQNTITYTGIFSLDNLPHNFFKLFPNSESGILMIDWLIPISNVRVSVFDVIGNLRLEEILQADVGTNQFVNLSSMPAGVYFVCLSFDGNIVPTKFIKSQ